MFGAITVQPMQLGDLCLSFDGWVKYAKEECNYVVVKGSDALNTEVVPGYKLIPTHLYALFLTLQDEILKQAA